MPKGGGKADKKGKPRAAAPQSLAEQSRGRKRKRGAPGGEAEATAEGGDQGRKKGREREVRVSDAAMVKWTPVSSAAKQLLTTAMVSALGQCLDEVRGYKKREVETAIQQVMQRVEKEVESARAPPTKRIQSSSHLRQRVSELKEQCMGLVSKNEGLEKMIEERKVFCDERTSATQQLAQPPPSTHTTQLSQPSLAQLDEEAFTDHIQKLLSHTSVSITTPTSPSLTPN